MFSAAFVQLLFADLTVDGTTPPAGTVVRLKMARYPLVANEPPAPAGADERRHRGRMAEPRYGRRDRGYSLPAAGVARVVVYDVLGREVAVLADRPAPAGPREVRFDATAPRAGRVRGRRRDPGRPRGADDHDPAMIHSCVGNGGFSGVVTRTIA